MKVDFKKSFTRDLKKIKDKKLLEQVQKAIKEVEKAEHVHLVSNLTQLRDVN